MDMMGDADELGTDEEVPPPRQPLVTTEGLAVTSLATAVASLLASFISQFTTFLLADYLGLNSENSQGKQFTLILSPVAILAFAAALCGVTALRRRPDNRWTGALALAGATLGVLVLVLVAAGFVVLLTRDPSSGNDGF
jgi:hypothetical protein